MLAWVERNTEIGGEISVFHFLIRSTWFVKIHMIFKAKSIGFEIGLLCLVEVQYHSIYDGDVYIKCYSYTKTTHNAQSSKNNLKSIDISKGL